MLSLLASAGTMTEATEAEICLAAIPQLSYTTPPIPVGANTR